MATTKKSQTAPATMKPDEGKKLNVVVTPGKSQAYMTASLLFDGVVGNAITAQTFAKGDFGTLDLTECVNVLREKAERTHSGDLRHAETTLTAQAAALDAIFNDMARRAALNAGQYLDAAERYLRLALKAQGARPVSGDARNVGSYQESAGSVRQASKQISRMGRNK